MDLDPRLDRDEADLLESVSADELMALTARLTSEVRLSGSAEERRAFATAAEALAAWGLQTRMLEHPAYISLPGPATLTVAGLGALNCITHSFAVPTPADGLTGVVIDVGDGAPADWANPAVRGKIALVNGLATPEQARRAGAAGSIAQIFINDDYLHEMILSPVWGNPTPEQLAHYPQRPAVSVVRSDGARIRAALANGPLEATLHTSVTTEWRTLPLLEAELKGAVEPERFVLFSGHIDSWHYGAMDNGGANATMLHLARLLAERRDQLRRSLRICFWSGHSHGRYAGSAWYIDNHWAELEARCVVHVYIDSVGGRGATLLSEAYCMAETRDLGRAIIGRYAGQEFHGTRVARAGDQSFTGIGVPSLLMTVSEQPAGGDGISASALVGGRSGGLGWWWHTTEDTLDKLDPAFLARDARLYGATIFRLCAEPIVPFNYAAAAHELAAQVDQHQAVVGDRFDLSALRERCSVLCAVADALQADLEALRQRNFAGAPTGDLAALNDALLRLGRATIPLNYTAAGPFGHDPALSVLPMPLLADTARLAAAPPGSDLAYAAAVGLRRSANQVVFLLDRALEAYRIAQRLL
jgi:hypothetical protein